MALDSKVVAVGYPVRTVRQAHEAAVADNDCPGIAEGIGNQFIGGLQIVLLSDTGGASVIDCW